MSRSVHQVGWDLVPWLDEETKKELLESTPINLRDSRSKGYPALGSGSVYQIPLESVVVPDRAIPAHWKRIYGLDVGWNKTAAVFGALNPEDDVLYIYSEHYQGHAHPQEHALAIKARFKMAGYEFPGLIDPASAGSSQIDGRRLIDIYRRECDLKLREAENAVETGIYAITDRLVSGRLKFFKTLVNLQSEYMIYRRDEKGKIIKERDHLMDALRYLVMGIRYAKEKPVDRKKVSGAVSGRNYFSNW